jgi:hypothetical protein
MDSRAFCARALNQHACLGTRVMDVQSRMRFLGRAAQKQLELCVLLIQIDCADDGSHPPMRQAADPDIDAVTV